MQIDQSQINELLSRPAESLNVEVKTWIDPDAPSGIAKIAHAALALRNCNGGYLLIGFDDKTPPVVHELIPFDLWLAQKTSEWRNRYIGD